MIQRYDPVIRFADYTGEQEAQMTKYSHGDYVSYHDHMVEVTKLQERIAELEINRDGGFHGDV